MGQSAPLTMSTIITEASERRGLAQVDNHPCTCPDTATTHTHTHIHTRFHFLAR